MAILDGVAKILEDAFGVDPASVTLETDPDDVENWDSIGHMVMVTGLQDEYEVEFDVDEVMELTSVRQIVEMLKTKGIED